MELEKLATLFACPACGQAQARLEDRAIACGACGRRFSLCGKSVLAAADVALSDAWKQKQAEGEGRYREATYNADDTDARLFGGFIAATASKGAVLLDIGCGIGEEPPPYVRELALENYIGLEPMAEAAPRSYACLAGAVAEKIPLASGTAFGMIFATSLDHIEHVGRAYAEARRVLAKDGRLYLWVGMYEPEMLARVQTYEHAFMTGSVARRIARFAFLHLVYARFVQIMLVRKYKLVRKIPVDEKHFRNYTRASLRAELEQHGMTIERQLLVPGSPSLFVEARFV